MCIDENLILDIVEGSRAAPEVSEHIATCVDCRQVLAESLRWARCGDGKCDRLLYDRLLLKGGRRRDLGRY